MVRLVGFARSLVLVAGAVVALAVGACKQGEGQRCQSNEDCEDGLLCSLALKPPLCQSSIPQDGSITPDAGGPPPDAPLVPIDAAVDAAVDAPDATPPP